MHIKKYILDQEVMTTCFNIALTHQNKLRNYLLLLIINAFLFKLYKIQLIILNQFSVT